LVDGKHQESVMDDDHAEANIRKEGGEFGRAAASTLGPGMSNQVASFEVRLRTMIEEQPYTATAIALALGWLLGRTHRPL
jgi:hypothetical protein